MIELARTAPSDSRRAMWRGIARSRRALAVVAIVAVGIGACGDGGNDDSVDGAGADGAGVDAANVEVRDAWARSSPPGVADGAAYMTVESTVDDQLIGVSVPTGIAAAAELHETMVGDGSAGDTGHDMEATEGTAAEMTMRPVTAVELPSGEPVAFAPGGLHVMLIDLAEPLESGSSFELTLTFANAEPKTVTVDIRDEAP